MDAEQLDSPSRRTRSKLNCRAGESGATETGAKRPAKRTGDRQRTMHNGGGDSERKSGRKRHSVGGEHGGMNGDCDAAAAAHQLNASLPIRAGRKAKARTREHGGAEEAKAVKQLDREKVLAHETIVRIEVASPPAATPETSSAGGGRSSKAGRKRKSDAAGANANDVGRSHEESERQPAEADSSNAEGAAAPVDEADVPLAERIMSKAVEFGAPPPLLRQRSSSVGSPPPAQGGDGVSQSAAHQSRHDSAVALLSQALLSGDAKKLHRILQVSDSSVIGATVSALAPGQVVPLLQQIAARMRLKPEMNYSLLMWLSAVLSTHASMLSALSATGGDLVSLREWLCARASTGGQLHMLKGRLDLLKDRLNKARSGQLAKAADVHVPCVVFREQSSGSESDSESDGAGTTDFANEWHAERSDDADGGDLARDWWDGLDEAGEGDHDQDSSAGGSSSGSGRGYGSGDESDAAVVGGRPGAKRRRGDGGGEEEAASGSDDDDHGAFGDLVLGHDDNDDEAGSGDEQQMEGDSD